MKTRFVLLAAVGLYIASVLGLTPGIADGGGGVFLDVATSHPAYTAVRDLVNRGIIVVGPGGQFQGDAPLLRYDAAQWLYRAIKNVQASGAEGMASELRALESRVSSLSGEVARQGTDLQALRTSVTTLSRDVQALQGTDFSGQVRINFVLGVTGLLLGVAALAIAIFW